MLAVSELLASSTQGHCKYTEDICQSIYSLDELIKYRNYIKTYLFFNLHSIITDPNVKLDRKKPFARLINWAYLQTERDSINSLTTLLQNKSFWKHLENCSTLMTSLHEKLLHKAIDGEQVRLKIRLLFAQHMSFTVRCLISSTL